MKKLLFLLASVVITGVLISFAFSSIQKTKQATEKVTTRVSDQVEKIKESSLVEHEGCELKGTEVRNLCSYYLGDFDYVEGHEAYADITFRIVHLISSEINDIEYRNNRYLNALKDSDDAKFVRPSSLWTCSIEYDSHGAPKVVTFTEE